MGADVDHLLLWASLYYILNGELKNLGMYRLQVYEDNTLRTSLANL